MKTIEKLELINRQNSIIGKIEDIVYEINLIETNLGAKKYFQNKYLVKRIGEDHTSDILSTEERLKIKKNELKDYLNKSEELGLKNHQYIQQIYTEYQKYF
ncbi:MAG: hypothetical protein AABW81_03640 [Nanoarchaeota archaeon]